MFFFGSEDEVRAKVDEIKMTGEAVSHQVESFLGSLDEDSLNSVQVIISACDSELFRGYTLGRIAQINHVKFGVCAGCGKKHDEDLKKLLGDPPPDKPAQPSPDLTASEDVSQRILLSDADTLNMRRYHLDDAYDDSGFVGFACTGTDGKGSCGMVYPSIEDRMLRDPDYCGGCIQRAKFG